MKQTINLNGNKVVIDTNRKAVAAALVALVEACAERQFSVGMILDHLDNDGQITEYQLVRIKQPNSTLRAYLINTEDGVARNSRKVVMVQDPTGGDNGRGYVTDIPAERDRFIDPDNDGQLLDC